MWNRRKFFKRLDTDEQCIAFAEERRLLPMEKQCGVHRRAMSIVKGGQVGRFRCTKSTCRTKAETRALRTWFENARLALTLIFQLMYAFSVNASYNDARIQCATPDEPALSNRTVADWYSYCRETIVLYEIENQVQQPKIGGPGNWKKSSNR